MMVMVLSIVVMIFMVGPLTSMFTVLAMMMVLLIRMFYWFAWFFQRCWFSTVASKRNHTSNLFFQSRKLCIWNKMIVISMRNRYATWRSA